MHNLTGSPIFSDYKSDLSRVARRNEDSGYEADELLYIPLTLQKAPERIWSHLGGAKDYKNSVLF